MNKGLLLAVISLFPIVCLAEEFAVEDPDLRLLPADAARAIRTDPTSLDYRSSGCEDLSGPQVDLAGEGQREDWVATTTSGCGWGAATAPIWVIRHDPRGFSIVLASGGSQLTLSNEKQNGMRQLVIVGGTARWYSEVRFKYDGVRYVKAHSREVDLSNPEDCRKNRDVCRGE